MKIILGTVILIAGLLVMEEYIRAFKHDSESAKHPIPIFLLFIPAVLLIISGAYAVFGGE